MSGVVVDIAVKRVYWCDPKVDRVESVDYSGNDRRQIASGRLNIFNKSKIFTEFRFCFSGILRPILSD